MHQELVTKYQKLKDKNLSIDITRGKPDTVQLDLSNDLIDIPISSTSDDGIDLRNYGEPFGIMEARKLGSNLDVIGPDYGITAFPAYLNNRASTIYGGSNEIQRNIMAKFVLGL